MKTYFCFCLLCGFFFLAGCGSSDVPSTAVPPSFGSNAFQMPASKEKTETPRYIYHGDRYRDPFIPLNGNSVITTSSSEGVAVPNIGTLTLKGILDDGKQKLAIIQGGGITYILRGSYLYDNRQRLIRGITGFIKKESVVMIAPDKTTKELALRQQEKE